MSRGVDVLVLGHAQGMADMLSQQRRQQRGRLVSLAHHHRIGQFGTEQQPTHPRVADDGPHDVGHPGARLLTRRCRRHRGLGGRGEVADHPVVHGADEIVPVREALVEVAG